MYNTSQCSRGILNKSDSEQKYDNFYYSSPKAATDMGVSSSESHDLTAFYEMLPASFGVLSQNTGFYPSLDRIIETTLGPLNLGPRGGSYNEPISRLHRTPFTHEQLVMISQDLSQAICDDPMLIALFMGQAPPSTPGPATTPGPLTTPRTNPSRHRRNPRTMPASTRRPQQAINSMPSM